MSMLILSGCGSSDNNEASSGGAGTVENTTPEAGDEKRAIATIEPRSGSELRGIATFIEVDGQVTLTVEVEGGSPGEHGIHLHEKGDCSAADASSAGDHWNPTAEEHGKMGETASAHSGDMGNLTIGEGGRGTLIFTTDRWSIGGDANKDVVGKALVIHAKADDLKTQPSGDAGDRIGCGVVE